MPAKRVPADRAFTILCETIFLDFIPIPPYKISLTNGTHSGLTRSVAKVSDIYMMQAIGQGLAAGAVKSGFRRRLSIIHPKLRCKTCKMERYVWAQLRCDPFGHRVNFFLR